MFVDVFTTLLYVLFVIASVLLILIVLLQEGSGGGLAGAFGGAGSEAFGVKAGGINKVTATMASIFLLCAISLGCLKGCGDSIVTDPPATEEAPDGESLSSPPDDDASSESESPAAETNADDGASTDDATENGEGGDPTNEENQ